VKAKLDRLGRNGPAKIPEETVTLFAKGLGVVRPELDIAQANVILGSGGISRDNPDFISEPDELHPGRR
jgi:hypothetical protein